jgi:hypothetical protein
MITTIDRPEWWKICLLGAAQRVTLGKASPDKLTSVIVHVVPKMHSGLVCDLNTCVDLLRHGEPDIMVPVLHRNNQLKLESSSPN